MRRALPLLLATLVSCARQDAAPAPPVSQAAAAEQDTSDIVTSIGRGAIVPRWVGLWTRTTGEGVVGLDFLLGGELRLVNLCDRRGASWEELEGDSLALRTTGAGEAAPREDRYGIRRFDDSVLVLAGPGPGQGSWTRSGGPVTDRCGGAP